MTKHATGETCQSVCCAGGAMQELRRKVAGFTLVELLVVVAILAALVTVSIPVFDRVKTRVMVTRSAADIRSMQNEITAFYVDNNSLPLSLADIGFGGKKDPFGSPYVYLNIATDPASARKGPFGVSLNTDYDLYSIGADGQTTQSIKAGAGLDDIVRGSDGGYLGEGSAF